MRSLQEILTDPRLRDVDVLAGDPSHASAKLVEFIEDLEASTGFTPHSLVILGRVASQSTTGYLLDVVVRRAAAQGVVALMLTGFDVPPRISATATTLAQRAGIALLSAPGGTSLTELIIAVSSSISGSAEEALQRAQDGLTNLERAEAMSEPGDITPLLAAASASLGVEVSLRSTPPRPVATTGPTDAVHHTRVATREVGGFLGVASRLVVALTNAAIERSISAATWGLGGPVRSRHAVLSDILIANDSHWGRLSDQARNLGIPIDGWHRALMLEIADTPDSMSYDLQQTIGEASLRTVRGPGTTWHTALSEDKVVLVEMWQHDPGHPALQSGLRKGQSVIDALGEHFPWLRTRCSLGRPHQGLLGLRLSVAEARSALALKSTENLVGYDLAGLQPMLMEWSGSDAARQAINELLKPLENLGEERARTAITTLQIYLDEQGSLVRAAARLFVHRNAVSYRMRQINELLDVNLEDADQRLAVQLACRAWLLR